jgi:hypothetical protein
MKKVLLVLTLTVGTLVSNAQTDTTGFANKIVNLFKSEVVNLSFKDPYSFQLLSVSYNEVTIGRSLEVKIMSDSISLKVYNEMPKSTKKWLPKSYKEEQEVKSKNIETNKELLSKMNDIEKNTIKHYVVRIECRGSNSYGGLVYSKYIAEWYPKTNTLGKYGFMNTSK